MNNAIDRAIAKLMNCSIADENCCNNPVTRAELYCILKAMKDPSPKPEMISIPRKLAQEWLDGDKYACLEMFEYVEKALRDKQ